MIRRQGFTLIELLIVVTIIAILAGAAVPYVQDYVDQTRTSRAKADIDEIKRALMLYEVQYGHYTSDTIASLVGPFLTRNLPDPWGNAYKVDDKKSRVYSMGPDGVDGNGDDVTADFRPRMAVTRVNFVDIDGDGVPSTNDVLSVRVCRPLASTVGTDNVLVVSDSGTVATLASATRVNDYTVQFTLGTITPDFRPGSSTLSVAANNAIVDQSNTKARADTLKILYQ